MKNLKNDKNRKKSGKILDPRPLTSSYGNKITRKFDKKISNVETRFLKLEIESLIYLDVQNLKIVNDNHNY